MPYRSRGWPILIHPVGIVGGARKAGTSALADDAGFLATGVMFYQSPLSELIGKRGHVFAKCVEYRGTGNLAEAALALVAVKPPPDGFGARMPVAVICAKFGLIAASCRRKMGNS